MLEKPLENWSGRCRVGCSSIPHQPWELLVIILVGFWGDCAANLIPNPKTLIPCGSAERWTGVVRGGNLIPWVFGVFFSLGVGFVFFLFFSL